MSLSNIPGLLEMRSVSKFGLSVVKLVFDDDTDVYWARQQVFERLELVKAEILQELGKPYMELSWVKGIAEVSGFGGYKKEYQVTLKTWSDARIQRHQSMAKPQEESHDGEGRVDHVYFLPTVAVLKISTHFRSCMVT